MTDDLELLAIDLRTLFVLDGRGQIVAQNDPCHSAGPRFWLAGCALGNVTGIGCEVTEEAAREIIELAKSEPAFCGVDQQPVHFKRYLELLAAEGIALRHNLGLIYQLPHAVEYDGGVAVVDSESEEGKRLYASWEKNGMPAGLVELGFKDAAELWEPWCVVLHEGQAASVAFAARLSEEGAEVGVATVRGLRGRGYAAAAVAAWSRMRTLEGRELFYSVDRENRSSRRVVARLGLRAIGASLRISGASASPSAAGLGRS